MAGADGSSLATIWPGALWQHRQSGQSKVWLLAAHPHDWILDAARLVDELSASGDERSKQPLPLRAWERESDDVGQCHGAGMLDGDMESRGALAVLGFAQEWLSQRGSEWVDCRRSADGKGILQAERTSGMKVVIVYIFPANAGPQHVEWAMRFVQSYKGHRPGTEHDTVVVLNAAKVTPEIVRIFEPFPNVTFLERDGVAMDIGGYQEAAAKFPCDLMVFFGGSSYLRGKNWLLRMVESFKKHGPGAYGVMGNRGDVKVNVSPHLRTTGWWTTPELMNRYPHRITRNEQRYEFEHGQTCFFNWVKEQGLPVMVVAWDGEYRWEDWDSFPEGYHRGAQLNLLCGDRLTCKPYYPYA